MLRPVAKSIGGSSFAVEVDVCSRQAADAAIDQVLRSNHQIDILVNNAGIAGKVAPTWEQTDEDWQKIIAINVSSVFISVVRSFHICVVVSTGAS